MLRNIHSLPSTTLRRKLFSPVRAWPLLWLECVPQKFTSCQFNPQRPMLIIFGGGVSEKQLGIKKVVRVESSAWGGSGSLRKGRETPASSIDISPWDILYHVAVQQSSAHQRPVPCSWSSCLQQHEPNKALFLTITLPTVSS